MGSPEAIYTSTTFDPPPGMKITRSFGTTFGVVVRSVGFAKGLTGSVRSLKAGEVPQYTQVLEDSRRHALDRMIANAGVMGANGVLAVRFDSAEIGQGLAEVVAYGTAVTLEAT
jgi:uncharacterized protein YbjQ (UPF0145 family)